jgi:hypothetical protein
MISYCTGIVQYMYCTVRTSSLQSTDYIQYKNQSSNVHLVIFIVSVFFSKNLSTSQTEYLHSLAYQHTPWPRLIDEEEYRIRLPLEGGKQ